MVDVFDLSLVKEEPLDESFVFSKCYTSTFLRTPLTLKTEPSLLRDCTTIQDIFEYENTDLQRFLTADIKTEVDFSTKKPRHVHTRMTDVLEPLENVPPRRKRNSEGKKTSGGSPYTSVPLPPCKVCSGISTGYHFGVITCEACKAFFRRALLHKHNYKCIKDDNCVITDKKLGNCSACRLRKCFDIGMSKGGVRRGRYSIAIRTQAILEAKAREAENVVMELIPTKKQRLDSLEDISDVSESSADSGLVFDAFDGFLDLDLAEFTITVEDEKPMAPPVFVENHELEFLIDAILSCQDAVYPSLKKAYTNAREMEKRHYKLFEDYIRKEEVFGDLFGTQSGFVSTEEYQQIFAETGLDLDDRLAMFNTKGRSMEENIAQYVNFAKLVPGFKALNPKDVTKLLKGAHMEFYLLGNFLLCNGKLGVCSSWDGTHETRRSEMIKFFEEDIVDATLEYSDRITKMNLTLEEIALIRLIALTYTDRCTLIETERIQHLQEKYVECLQYYLSKSVHNPGQRLSQLMNLLLSLRDVTHLNIKANKKFLKEWDFVMHDYPLWKEMLSYDGE